MRSTVAAPGGLLCATIALVACCRSSAAPGELAETAPVAEAAPVAHSAPRARDVRITLLSTTLAGPGAGEWGFAALVEVDGRRILFDTGKNPDTVLDNARALGIDLASVSDVVLSHHHDDHIGGLMTLRRAFRDASPAALATVHVAEGMFTERRRGGAGPRVNRMVAIKAELEALGVRFVIHERPVELAPGVWLTGPVARVHDERNWSGTRRVPAGPGRSSWIEDTVPESQSLVIDTDRGLVVLSGCGHAGIVNTIEYARAHIRDAPVHAAVGGFHLVRAGDQHLRWTAEKLARARLRHFLGAHCTGSEAIRRVAAAAGLDRTTAVVGAVGSRFTLAGGIDPGPIVNQRANQPAGQTANQPAR